MAKATKATSRAQQNRLIEPVARYLRETRAELRKVTWPSREEAWNLTLIVLGTVVVMAALLGAGDFLFSKIMRGFVTNDLVWIGVGALVIIGGVAAVYAIERE